MSRKIATLGSLNNRDDSKDSDEERQAFYAGGSDRSGQQVLGSPKKKDADKLVKDMFQSARQHGGRVLDDSAESSSSRPRPAFAGSGYRLGTELGPTAPIPSSASSTSQDVRNPVDMVLKLWRNGFSVDDGPLRSYDDPADAEFLRSVRIGEIPRELLTLARGGEVNLSMEDHRQEDYVTVKKPVKVFGGVGHRLGGVAPEVSAPANPTAEDSSKNNV